MYYLLLHYLANIIYILNSIYYYIWIVSPSLISTIISVGVLSSAALSGEYNIEYLCQDFILFLFYIGFNKECMILSFLLCFSLRNENYSSDEILLVSMFNWTCHSPKILVELPESLSGKKKTAWKYQVFYSYLLQSFGSYLFLGTLFSFSDCISFGIKKYCRLPIIFEGFIFF